MKAHNFRKKAASRLNGKRMYVSSPWDNLKGFVAVTGLSAVFYGYSLIPSPELISPLVAIHPVETVEAAKIVPITPHPTQTPVRTERGEIEAYIREVFRDEAENAIKIAACESKLNPNQIGDQHLMGVLNGETIGDSVGVFQVRTGDAGTYDKKPWNRAKANGMSVEEFRAKLRNYRYNIDYAKKMYDGKGWGQWHNCMIKEGIK